MYTTHTDDRLDEPFRAPTEPKAPPRVAASSLMVITALSISLLSAGVGAHIFWVVPALLVGSRTIPLARALRKTKTASEPASAED